MSDNSDIVNVQRLRWTRQLNHQHAIPYTLGLTDVCMMDRQGQSTAGKLMDKLLANLPINDEIQASSKSVHKLRHLYTASHNQLHHNGRNPLAIGYPVVLIPDMENAFAPLAIPVFFWRMKMEYSANRLENWQLISQEDTAVFINPAILELLAEAELSEEFNALWEQKSTGLKDKVTAFSKLLIKKLGIDTFPTDDTVNPFPDSSSLNQLPDDGALARSAVLGLFSFYSKLGGNSSEESFIQHQSASDDPTVRHFFSPRISGHPMSEILQTVYAYPLSAIVGEAGSGKAEAAAAIVANALSNGLKCLVISDSQHGLKRIQLKLQEWKLGNLGLLLKDEHTDVMVLIDLLQNSVERSSNAAHFDEENFENKLEKVSYSYNQLQKQHAGLKQLIFDKEEGALNWNQAAGEFLQSNSKQGKELLNNQLQTSNFVFTSNEYETLAKAVSDSQAHYSPINTLSHPLESLHPFIFQENTGSQEASSYLSNQLKTFVGQARELQHKFIGLQDGYSEALISKYENDYNTLKKTADNLRSKIKEYRTTYGKSFVSGSGTAKLQLYGVFSNKYKQIIEAREEVLDMYSSLKKTLANTQHFDFRFQQTNSIKRILSQLDEFEETLLHWQKRVTTVVQDELFKLNSKNANGLSNFQEQLEELEYSLDLFIQEINDANIYDEPLTNNVLNLHRGRQLLEKVIEKLERSVFDMRDFDSFFHWQKNWLQLSPLAKKVITALIRVKPGDWSAAFKSWYFHNILLKSNHINLPQDASLLEAYAQGTEDFRTLFSEQTHHFWQQKFSTSLSKLKRSNKKVYNRLFKKENATAINTVSQLTDGAISVITDSVPVVMALPEMATDVFLSQAGIQLDVLVILEADNIAFHQASSLISIAGHTVVLGNSHPSPENGNTVMAFASENAAVTLRLDKLTYPFSKKLFQFNQAFYYENRPSLISKPDQVKGETKAMSVNGRYDENERINTAEAEAVIRYLSQVERNAQQTYPSVAIACTTIAQRNLIADYLLKIKQRRAEGSERIRQLERNGLSVVTLQELKNTASELRILSLTFGTIDTQGTLSEDIGYFNSPYGRAALRLACTQPCKDLVVMHSLPEQDRSLLFNGEHGPAHDILDYLLSYAEQEDRETAERICQIGYFQRTGETLQQFKATKFIQQVASALHPYLSGRIITDYHTDIYNFPMVISSKEQGYPTYAIIVDAGIGRRLYCCPDMLLQEQEILRIHGYEPINVWTVKWWKDARQEARKLASLIIKKDEMHKNTLAKERRLDE